MSMHRSLKAASKVATRRNVLKRFERIEVMKAADLIPHPPGRKTLGFREESKGFCFSAREAGRRPPLMVRD